MRTLDYNPLIVAPSTPSVTPKSLFQQRTRPVSDTQGLPQIVQQLLAIVALCLLSPVMVLTVLLIKLESRGPAMFSQIRVGKDGRRFTMYKFRSMYLKDDKRYVEPQKQANDRDGICQKFFHDPRITRVGRVIRKLSIDELPQLFNVLTGDMLLIGPRPALPCETDKYGYTMLERLDCKPGLTGLWQVSGRADTSFDEQIQLDIRYVRERDMLMDIKIMFATVPAVLLGKGAY